VKFNDNKKIAVCRKCKTQISSRAIRFKAHYTICQKQSQLFAREPSEEGHPSDTCNATGVADDAFPKRIESQKTIKSFLSRVTKKQNDDIQKAIARFIFSANLSFRTVENPFFKDLLQKLNPAITLPTRQNLSTKLLNEIHQDTVEIVHEELKNCSVTIIQDGCSTAQNEAVICHCLHNGSKSQFLNVVTPGKNSKTAEYCFKMLEEAMNLAT